MQSPKPPLVICVSGLKNSGKTALIEALIPLLAEKGIKTAVIKHHGHGFAGEIPDKPGTDTYRFLANGAYGTVIYDETTQMCVKRSPASIDSLIALFPEVDLIIIEGAKSENAYPHIAMLRKGQPLPTRPENTICAVTDIDYKKADLPSNIKTFNFGNPPPVANLLAKLLREQG